MALPSARFPEAVPGGSPRFFARETGISNRAPVTGRIRVSFTLYDGVCARPSVRMSFQSFRPSGRSLSTRPCRGSRLRAPRSPALSPSSSGHAEKILFTLSEAGIAPVNVEPPSKGRGRIVRILVLGRTLGNRIGGKASLPFRD